MAVGDVKGEDYEIIYVVFGSAVAIGQVVHIEADGYWDAVVDGDKGKFGVALDAGTVGTSGRVLIRGKVEVKATAAAIAKGELVMAGYTTGVEDGLVAKTDHGAVGENVGTAMEAAIASANLTIYVGLVE
jgi:hypothetical protein